jgi:N-acetylmuramoyl-L-alanine amidase
MSKEKLGLPTNPVINKKLCPDGLKNNPNKKMSKVEYITIHTTANYAPTATAKNHAAYQYGGSGGTRTSRHYMVDANEIWQSFEDDRVCWHAGDVVGNETSVGVEICVNDKTAFRAACDKAAWLVAELLKKHGLGLEHVVQHYKWSGKNCPAELRSGEWGVNWPDFRACIHNRRSNK